MWIVDPILDPLLDPNFIVCLNWYLGNSNKWIHFDIYEVRDLDNPWISTELDSDTELDNCQITSQLDNEIYRFIRARKFILCDPVYICQF